jgi:hypothetical protein
MMELSHVALSEQQSSCSSGVLTHDVAAQYLLPSTNNGDVTEVLLHAAVELRVSGQVTAVLLHAALG